MALTTKSVFYYGHVIGNLNYQLDFDEGFGEVVAELNTGSYSLTEFRQELERALNAASNLPQTYDVTLDRTTRILTITAPSAFSLLISTGSHVGTSVFTLAGFTGADTASLTTQVGDSGSGSQYEPQLELQKYTASSNWKNPVSSSVNVSTTGKVEAITFGGVRFTEFNIMWVTNTDVSNVDWLDNSPTAVEDLVSFMDAITDKGNIEFMEDKTTRSTYETLLLEKTKESSEGVGYKLTEFLGKKLPDWYETKMLTFRKVII